MKKYRVETEDLLNLKRGDIVTSEMYIDGQSIEKLAKFTNWFSPIEEEFKEGDWVKYKNSEGFLIRHENKKNNLTGFDRDYDWNTNIHNITRYNPSEYRKATKDEIEQALIAEAKRRGLSSKVRVKRDWNFVNELNYDAVKIKSKLITSGVFDYDAKRDVLFMGKDLEKTAIYWEGNWAEIVDEPIQINGHEAEFKDGYVQFGCAKIDNRFFTSTLNPKLTDCWENSGKGNRKIKAVKIGNGLFTIEDIKKIAKRIKDENF